MTQLLAIIGPTASGKSGLALEIAKNTNGAIVNGDPFQAYQGIAIGTGQPDSNERQEIPHFGYGILPLACILNPASFGVMVRNWLGTAQKAHKTLVLVTGSGLYLRGIWNQLDELPDVPEEIVIKVRHLCHTLSPSVLHRYLYAVDPQRASQLHKNDASRIQRALALHIATGARPSELLTGTNKSVPSDWNAMMVLPQREVMKQRIALRVNKMIECGWQNEVRRLVRNGHESDLRRLRPIGYDVWLESPDAEIAKPKIIQVTQAYAKRQVTWFRNQLSEVQVVDPEEESSGGLFLQDHPKLLSELSKNNTTKNSPHLILPQRQNLF